jgi:hypothetical protein
MIEQYLAGQTYPEDLQYLLWIDKTEFEETYPTRTFRKPQRDVIEKSNIYGDPNPDWKWQDPVEIQCIVKAESSEKTLEKYGVETRQPVTILFSLELLREMRRLGKGYKPESGDRLLFRGGSYEVMFVKATDYLENTEIPLHIFALADLVPETELPVIDQDEHQKDLGI